RSDDHRRDSGNHQVPLPRRLREIQRHRADPCLVGQQGRVRLSRGGNRTINTALHMAALTQIRMGAEGAAYYDKLIAAGKTRKEALRLLRRRLSDRVYAAQRADVVP